MALPLPADRHHTGSKADKAKALTGLHFLFFLRRAENSPRHQTGNLHNHNLTAIFKFYQHGLALIGFAGLVQIGAQKLAGAVKRFLHRPVTGMRLTWQLNTFMKTDTQSSGLLPDQARRRHGFGNHIHHTVSRAYHQPFALRRHPCRIAEKPRTRRQHDTKPAEKCSDKNSRNVKTAKMAMNR